MHCVVIIGLWTLDFGLIVIILMDFGLWTE